MSVGVSAYTLVALSIDRMCIVRMNSARKTAASNFFSRQTSTGGANSRASNVFQFLCCFRTDCVVKFIIVAFPWFLSILVAAPVIYFRTTQEPPKIEELMQIANITSIHKILKQLHEGVSQVKQQTSKC